MATEPPSKQMSRRQMEFRDTGSSSSSSSSQSIPRPVMAPKRAPTQQTPDTPPSSPSPKRSKNERPRLGSTRASSEQIVSQRESDARRALSFHQLVRPTERWNAWHEVAVVISNVPANFTTLDVYDCLRGFGQAPEYIELPVSGRRRPGDVLVRFSPPPTNSSWIHNGIAMNLSGRQHRISCRVLDPRRDQQSQPGLTISGSSIGFGVMQTEDHMRLMRSLDALPHAPIKVVLNTKRGWFELHFSVVMHDAKQQVEVTRQFMLRIPLSQLHKAYESRDEDGNATFVVSSDAPPMLFRKTDNIAATHEAKATQWDERQAWFRQVAIDAHPEYRKDKRIELQDDYVVVNVGRWLTYRFVCDKANSTVLLSRFREAMASHNIPVINKDIEGSSAVQTSLWSWLEDTNTSDFTDASVSALDQMAPSTAFLNFKVRYQLEVCISQGYLHESNLDTAFGHRLASMDPDRAMKLLEKVAEIKRRFFKPMDIFKLQAAVTINSRTLPRYCTMVRSATVTPTTIYFNSPASDTSNRVIREWKRVEDRFLRVKFRDENYKGTIMTFGDGSDNELFEHVQRTMTNGIMVGDRHYEFLAYGNSQFREHGAYFFSPTLGVSTASIRQWMGNFEDIKVVAKYASRVGQCFSTTRAMTFFADVQHIPDIERNGFCFTDGVGKISEVLAQMTAGEMDLPSTSADCPSVFQFRMGGCKGVLTVDPSTRGNKVLVRPSQEKFPTALRRLEICRIAQYSTAYLNQQIILVLSALGVADAVFVKMLTKMLSNLELAMIDENMALNLLQSNVDLCQTTVIIAAMILDGFMSAQDPFLISVLRLWRSWSTKYLKEKAKIFVEQGAFILGVVDEVGVLKGHFNDMPVSDTEIHNPNNLPEIFLQIPDPETNGKFKIVTGVCALARNPSLHPGDIRIVHAVDKPELRHLKNCVVLPQTGDRDIPGMCSGGDLDGDDYLVMWDRDLLPTEWNHAPMDYTPPAPVISDGPVTVDAMTNFFVTHMKNDSLPIIATAHRYTADRTEEGVKHSKCLELAALHSKAVDYAKTGVPAQMPKELRVKEWPHWAEKKDKRCYTSKKILGQLYDEVDRVPFIPAWDAPFDPRVLLADIPDDTMLASARKIKAQYDEAIRRLMAQHGIKTEFEAWTTFVLEHNHESRDYKIAEELGENIAGLKMQFKDLCYEAAGTTRAMDEWEKVKPFVVAMYTVTAREVEAAREKFGLELLVRMGGETPLMSFPWLFQREMGKIAKRREYFDGSVAAVLPMARKVGRMPGFGALGDIQAPKELEVWTGEDLLTAEEAPDVPAATRRQLSELAAACPDTAKPAAANDMPRGPRMIARLSTARIESSSQTEHTVVPTLPTVTPVAAAKDLNLPFRPQAALPPTDDPAIPAPRCAENDPLRLTTRQTSAFHPRVDFSGRLLFPNSAAGAAGEPHLYALTPLGPDTSKAFPASVEEVCASDSTNGGSSGEHASLPQEVEIEMDVDRAPILESLDRLEALLGV